MHCLVKKVINCHKCNKTEIKIINVIRILNANSNIVELLEKNIIDYFLTLCGTQFLLLNIISKKYKF